MAITAENAFGAVAVAGGAWIAASEISHLASGTVFPLHTALEPAAHSISELFGDPNVIAGLGVMAFALILLLWGGKMLGKSGGGGH